MRSLWCGLAVLLPVVSLQAATSQLESTVGPAPQRAATTADGKGSLRVYTAVRLVSNGAVSFREETSYRIYSTDGKLVKKVANSVPFQTTGPIDVRLAPGNYTVVGEGDFYPSVHVPVEIVAGEMTSVHLAGSWLRPAHAPEDHLVKLPNGEVVGWRAPEGNPAPQNASASR